MKTAALLFSSLAIFLVTLLPVAPAQAAPRTWVASYGSGTTCSRSLPCAFFQFAHNAADAGGEINCIDAGDFGGADITKSITIDCGGTFGGAGTTGFAVNTAGVVLRLRNLSINGTGGIGNSSAGISFFNGTALIVENCTIAGPFALFSVTSGIIFGPSPAGAQLVVTDTSFTNNGSGLAGAAILVKPQSGGTARVALN